MQCSCHLPFTFFPVLNETIYYREGFSYPCLLGHLTLGYVCKVYISSQIKQLSALITEMAHFFHVQLFSGKYGVCTI